jgi:Domain of unknown function (DUF4041)/T5orf172 domain
MTEIVAIVFGVLALVLALFSIRIWQQVRRMNLKYQPMIDAEERVRQAEQQLEEEKQRQKTLVADSQQRVTKLEIQYEDELARYKVLQKEVSALEENLEDISFGLYKPHFSFQTSEEYKVALDNLRNQERQIIRDKRAVACPVRWTVQNSATKGDQMVRQYTKLMLRAFNGESDAAVANVAWNNISKMQERVRKAFESLNDLGGVTQVSITPEYLKLKLDELRLAYEYDEKRHQEREEQRRFREQIREEEKAQKELERAREEAERQEADYEKALAKAREEALKATGAQLQELTERVKSFEAKLDEARKKKERAISRAQLTKSGFVYVISNIGSFGERVFKIGMTRRMEPMDRIHELGDASVPFPFDVHVMLYSDNAPELENALHKLVQNRTINLVNLRREFYRDVDLDEIETFVKQRGLSAQFIRMAEAREYRQSVAIRSQRLASAA